MQSGSPENDAFTLSATLPTISVEINNYGALKHTSYQSEKPPAEIIIVKRFIQGRNNVTRVRVEPKIMRSGSS